MAFNNNWRSWNRPKTVSSNPVPPGANPKISDPSIKSRLETLLANPELQKNLKSVDFMKQLLDRFNQSKYLSQKQVDCITRTELMYNNEAKSAASEDFEAWKTEYSDEKRYNAIKVAKWYEKTHLDSKVEFEKGMLSKPEPFYYQRTAEKVLNDENYIPTRDEYKRMVENTFAERYLKNSANEPRFHATEIVKLTTAGEKRFKTRFPFESGLVINVAEPKKNIQGGYIVTVLPTGTDSMIDLEERWLKKYRG